MKIDIIGVSNGLVESTDTDIYLYKELNKNIQFSKSNVNTKFS